MRSAFRDHQREDVEVPRFVVESHSEAFRDQALEHGRNLAALAALGQFGLYIVTLVGNPVGPGDLMAFDLVREGDKLEHGELADADIDGVDRDTHIQTSRLDQGGCDRFGYLDAGDLEGRGLGEGGAGEREREEEVSEHRIALS